jgi:16S rRNA (guanine527-N7)-methyltransferase
MTGSPFHMEPPLASFKQMLEQVGRRVNLVSNRDLAHLEERHLRPCHEFGLWVAELQNRRILDLGSGGGLPGIPVALCNPQADVLLCESVGKKAEFLERVVRRLGLSRVRVLNERIETLNLADKPDLITARFFGTIEEILQISAHLRAPVTRYLLIKGEEEDLPDALLGYRLQDKRPIGAGKRAVLYTPNPSEREGIPG